jgi:hypothetical protein
MCRKSVDRPANLLICYFLPALRAPYRAKEMAGELYLLLQLNKHLWIRTKFTLQMSKEF